MADKIVINDTTTVVMNGSSGGVSTYDALTDTPSSKSGEALKFVRVNAAETSLEYTASSASVDELGDIGDVTITSVASGEIIKWNGSAWINNTLAEAGIAAASHTHTASDVTDFDTEVSNNTSVAANTTHRSSDGSDHTFIDQNVTSASSPNFVNTNMSGNVSVWTNDAGYITATLTDEEVQDVVGAMVSGNTETLITVTYQDADGTIDFTVDNDLSNYDNTTSGFIANISEDSTPQLGGNLDGGANDIAVNAGQKIILDGAGGDTYLIYNSGTGNLEFYVDGVKRGHM